MHPLCNPFSLQASQVVIATPEYMAHLFCGRFLKVRRPEDVLPALAVLATCRVLPSYDDDIRRINSLMLSSRSTFCLSNSLRSCINSIVSFSLFFALLRASNSTTNTNAE